MERGTDPTSVRKYQETMNDPNLSDSDAWPGWLRFGVIATATLILASCRAAGHRQHPMPCPAPATAGSATAAVLPAQAGAFAGGGAPLPIPGVAPNTYGPWSHTAGPWPREEFLRDGGDYVTPAAVRQDYTVSGLETEDAVGHFDTLDGRTVVEPSNRVHIYAPRFGAVRRVDTALGHESHDHAAGMDKPLKLVRHDDLQIATTAIQPIQPEGQLGSKAASIYRERQQGGELHLRQHLSAAQDTFLPHEDFQVIRLGIVDQGEKARLAKAVEAAIVWTRDEAVQVVIDGKAAAVLQLNREVEQIYVVDVPDQPKLRVIKTASTDTARQGETVDFTLRFDNVGDQTMGNVTILDNLSTRLEYVADSQQSSRAAEFSTEANHAGSDLLRWDFEEPLKPGDGGIIRFRCKVR
jgi:uncharacterized repeat protein (TIGR01451 family)